MKFRLTPNVALGCLLAWPLLAPAAPALNEFTEAGGCRVRGSPESTARLKEIASEGSVTWLGECTGGYIDGVGIMRHQGLTRTNDRVRRYVFYFSGTAKAGVRVGTWSRETFNMFEDSSKYWTSLATITYVDGVAKGAPKLRDVRSNAEFSAPFRAFLAETDRRLAGTQEKPAPQPVLPGSAKPDSAGNAFQGSGLKPLNSPATPLAAATQRQEVIEQGAACVVDEINGTVVRSEPIVASAGQPLTISGWAADPRQPSIPERAWIRLFDRGGGPGLLLEMPRNTNRPDVASALGNAIYARAGFFVTIEPGRLSPGEYTIAIVQQLGDNMAVCKATGRLSLIAGEVRAAPSPR